MNIDVIDLQLEEISMMQLGDSFFPTGMYTTSSGLESLFYNRKIKDKQKKKFKGLTSCILKMKYYDIRRPDFEQICLNIEETYT